MENQIRKRIFLNSGAGIIFLVIIFFIGFYWSKQNDLENHNQNLLESAQSIFEGEIDSNIKLMNELAGPLMSDPTIREMYLSKDRDGLLEAATPIFEDIRLKYNITHMYFHGLDNVNFLRVHNPGKNGDLITRFTLTGASDSGSTYSGIELGNFGTFTLRNVHPWRIDGEIVGYVELGEEISHITVLVSRILNVQVFVLIRKEYLERGQWEEGLQMAGLSGDWDHLPDAAVIDRSEEIIPKEVFDFLALQAEGSDHAYRVTAGGQKLIGNFIDLVDAGNRTVGRMAVLDDVTLEINSFNKLLIILAYLTFGILGLIGGIVWINLGRLEKDLTDTYSALKDNEKNLKEEISQRRMAESDLAQQVVDLKEAREATLNMMADIQMENTERKLAEEALLQSNKALQNLNNRLESTAGEIKSVMRSIVENPDSNERYSNNSLVRCWETTGCTKSNCPAYNNIDLRCWEIADTLCSNDTCGEFPEKLNECRGCEVYKHARQDSICELGETFNEMLVILEDRQRELRESEEKFRSISSSAQDGIVMIDNEGNVSFWNKAAEEMFGYASEEIIGKNLHDTIAPQRYHGPHHQAFPHFQQTGEGDAVGKLMELVGLKKDGTEFPIELTVSPIELDGEWHAVGIIRDITERKEDEERIRRMAKISEQALEGICIADLEGIVQFANPAWIELHGFESTEVIIGKHLSMFHTEEQLKNEVIPFNESVLINGSGVGEIGHVRKDGTTFPAEMRVTLFRDENDEPVGLLALMTDITERKESEENIRQAKEELEITNAKLEKAIKRANEYAEEAKMASVAKSEFLANMSHEIRTPMNGVIGMVSLLLDTEMTSEQRDYAETVKNSADSLLAIINDILDFSKIEAGKFDVDRIDFNLRATMDEIVDPLALRAYQKGIELTCLVEPDVPSLLIGDPGRIRQILINLAGNAIKFTSKGEVEINISLENEGGSTALIRFAVSDTGIGIPSDRLGKLWESFTQIDASTTRKYGGTGLGLAISKQLAEMMGGQIGVGSIEGEGSTFWFTIKLKKQPKSMVTNEAACPDFSGNKILCVDDNRTNRRLLSVLINNWDCEFEEAHDGITALKKLHTARDEGKPYHVAILDMLMPGMNGEELGAKIKNDPALKDTILIMLASLGRRGDASRLQKAGFAAYLTKPIKQTSLYDCLETVILEKKKPIELQARSIITRHSIIDSRRKRVRILLAEDNPVNRKVALKVLEKIGYHADAVVNGKEAIQALETTNYDLVLMDCQMSEMDGYEATHAIRDPDSNVINHDVLIIAMTAHALPDDRNKCIEAGMDDYLPKPVKPQDLSDCIEKWLSENRDKGPNKKSSDHMADDGVVSDSESPDEHMGGDRDLLHDAIDAFLLDLPNHIQNLRDAASSNDPSRIQTHAHSIKDSAGNVGAVSIQQTALEVEQAVKESSLDGIASLISRLDEHFEAFRKVFSSDEKDGST